MPIPSDSELKAFNEAYKRLSEKGRCDAPGGGEYCRVLGEWVVLDEHPEDLDTFIVERANAMPG